MADETRARDPLSPVTDAEFDVLARDWLREQIGDVGDITAANIDAATQTLYKTADTDEFDASWDLMEDAARRFAALLALLGEPSEEAH